MEQEDSFESIREDSCNCHTVAECSGSVVSTMANNTPYKSVWFPALNWSERRDSNPRQFRWQRNILPLNYSRIKMVPTVGIAPTYMAFQTIANLSQLRGQARLFAVRLNAHLFLGGTAATLFWGDQRVSIPLLLFHRE